VVAGSASDLSGNGADARVVDAYRALRADPSIQFHLTKAPPPPESPQWLRTLGHWVADVFRPIGRLIGWISSMMPDAPYARIILWTVLIVARAGVLWAVAIRFREGVWRWPRKRRPRVVAAESEMDWQPDAAPARAWLKEADALAAGGHYAEAVHHLLRRTIEDIERRRPGLLRPALTSRDIGTEPALPERARTIFAAIAAVVECSLFGGRAVSADEWTEARTAYADFVLAKAWTR
jgi:hypothetical protein